MDLQIDIHNFRSIKHTRLNIRSGVNILIGPNGSGKTSLFLALKFLRDVMLQGAGLAIAKGGGPKRSYRRRESEICFVVEYDLGQRVFRRRTTPFRLTWEIHISQRGKEEIATIVKERAVINALKDGQAFPMFEAEIRRNDTSGAKHKMRIAETETVGRDLFSYLIRDVASSENKSAALTKLKKDINEGLKQAKKSNDKSFFPQLARFDDDLSFLYSTFQNLNEYNILPDIARQSTDQLPFAEMLPNGANLSEVINALVNKNFGRMTRLRPYQEEQDYFSPYYYRPYYLIRRIHPIFRSRQKESPLENALENINNELSAAVKPIESVSVDIDRTNGKRFVIFKAGKDIFYPEEVSDGTIKWLCILVSIYVPFSQIYLLEEPENFLHPWMQQKLITLMREQAGVNKTIFLLTTHSSTILNAATNEEVIIVKATDRGTVVNSIHDKEEIAACLTETDFGLGDLWVSGAIGGVPGE